MEAGLCLQMELLARPLGSEKAAERGDESGEFLVLEDATALPEPKRQREAVLKVSLLDRGWCS